jgi:energy-coupling factor transport system ATP-binding protein
LWGSAMSALIEIQSLHHTYPSGVEALRGIDVAIHAQEFVAIMGQNGSGKTTFVKHLNGLLKPTKGKVYVKGENSTKKRVSELARDVGYVFQNPDHQIFCETVETEVSFGPNNLGLEEAHVMRRVQEALAAVGLLEYRDVNPKQLSKGQRQRLAVASVLSMNPSILIVDEPTTGQDYRDSIEMLNLVKRLNDDGCTILFITHDMQLIAKYAQRVIVFHDGKILLHKSTREAFSETEILKQTFLSPPSITLLAQRFNTLYPDTVLTVEEMLDKTMDIVSGNRGTV